MNDDDHPTNPADRVRRDESVSPTCSSCGSTLVAVRGGYRCGECGLDHLAAFAEGPAIRVPEDKLLDPVRVQEWIDMYSVRDAEGIRLIYIDDLMRGLAGGYADASEPE